MDDREYQYLKQQIMRFTGIDLGNYKDQQMRRRLDGFLERIPVSGAAGYCKMLEENPEALQRLKDFLTINVSEFFRDPRTFQVLQNRILPALLRGRPSLNVWSAGCSIGAEPYTLAMIIQEVNPSKEYRILATDLDQQVLAKARAGGPYATSDVKNVPRHFLLKYFSNSDQGYWVVDGIKSKVTFRQHNLLKDSFERGFELIACRNVVIYFSDEAKRQLNRGFHRSLKDDGILFIGSTETLLDAQQIGFNRLDASFYQKTVKVGREVASASVVRT